MSLGLTAFTPSVTAMIDDIYKSRTGIIVDFDHREDKGQLLENYGFLRLQEKFEEQQVKFWRTADKREIDFIVSESYERGTISVTTAEISMILPRIIDQDEITRRLSVSGNSGYSSLLYRHSLLVTCH